MVITMSSVGAMIFAGRKPRHVKTEAKREAVIRNLRIDPEDDERMVEEARRRHMKLAEYHRQCLNLGSNLMQTLETNPGSITTALQVLKEKVEAELLVRQDLERKVELLMRERAPKRNGPEEEDHETKV